MLSIRIERFIELARSASEAYVLSSLALRANKSLRARRSRRMSRSIIVLVLGFASLASGCHCFCDEAWYHKHNKPYTINESAYITSPGCACGSPGMVVTQSPPIIYQQG